MADELDTSAWAPDSPATLVRVLVYATKLRKALDDADRRASDLEAENARLRDGLARATTESAALSERLQRQVASVGQLNDDDTPETGSDDNDGRLTQPAHQAYSWFARLDDSSGRWVSEQDGRGFPVDADYLLHDAEIASALREATRPPPARGRKGGDARGGDRTAALAHRLVHLVARAEVDRNRQLEVRKAQLQDALEKAAAARCLHDCSARLTAFEKARIGLDKHHTAKITQLVQDAIVACREQAVHSQRERALAAEMEVTRAVARSHADATVRHVASPLRHDVADDSPPPTATKGEGRRATTAAAHEADATAFATGIGRGVRSSGTSTLPEPSGVASSFATTANPSTRHLLDASTQSVGAVSDAAAQAGLGGRSGTAPAVAAPDHLALSLYADLQRTRQATADAPDLHAELRRYQRELVARANPAAAASLAGLSARRPLVTLQHALHSTTRMAGSPH